MRRDPKLSLTGFSKTKQKITLFLFAKVHSLTNQISKELLFEIKYALGVMIKNIVDSTVKFAITDPKETETQQ